MPVYSGSCHCGAVRFEIEVEAPPDHMGECNCSICARKGSLYVRAPELELRILCGESELTAYRFGTQTATHYFCRHCGIHPFHRPRRNPAGWAVNARCLEDFDALDLPRDRFDGRNFEAAVARSAEEGS